MSWSGKLKCFGKNNRGQLGYGDTENRGDDADEMGDNLDYVDLGSGFNVSALAVENQMGVHLCAADQVEFHDRENFNELTGVRSRVLEIEA